MGEVLALMCINPWTVFFWGKQNSHNFTLYNVLHLNPLFWFKGGSYSKNYSESSKEIEACLLNILACLIFFRNDYKEKLATNGQHTFNYNLQLSYLVCRHMDDCRLAAELEMFIHMYPTTIWCFAVLRIVVLTQRLHRELGYFCKASAKYSGITYSGCLLVDLCPCVIVEESSCLDFWTAIPPPPSTTSALIDSNSEFYNSVWEWSFAFRARVAEADQTNSQCCPSCFHI